MHFPSKFQILSLLKFGGIEDNKIRFMKCLLKLPKYT